MVKERSQIEEQYKWDLSPLCKSDDEFYKRLEKVNVYLKKFKAFEGKLNDKKTLWKYLQLSKQFDEEFEPICLYAHLKGDEILSDNSRNEMEEKLSNVFSEFSIETSSLSNEIHSLDDDFLNELIADKKFKDYDRMFELIKRDKQHILSPQEEKLLSGMNFLGGFSTVANKLCDVDLKFEDAIDEKGKAHKLTQSNYGAFMRSKDRTLRKNTMKNLNGAFGKFINTLSANYINDVKADCYLAKVRHYDSVLQSELFGEEVSEKVYRTLIKAVNENFDVLFDYFDLKKKQLSLKDFYIYDVMADVDKGEKKKFTYHEAMELIKKALSPLGEEYVRLLDRAEKERWIDVFPNKDKRSGAYQTGIYGFHPYVLSNFEGDLDSVFTLAHELGHAMHSYFSDKNQPREKSGYTIFLAEIASTTNEMLLLRYLLDNAKNDREKISLYNKLFDEVKSTLFRQTMFAEFEEKVHSMQENGESLTKDKLCDYYYSLNEKYFGKTKLIPEIKYEWARIPHFFTAFYVYKYATGITTAIAFVNKILTGSKEELDKYYSFLCAGASKDPITILRNAGCDLEDESTFTSCFDYLRNMLENWKKIA